MKSFSEIYLLNLHGSALLGETAPDGGKDENVFDIRQGVAIALFVRSPSRLPKTSKVYYADLWGLRDGKYRYLLENDVSTTNWQTLEPVSPYFFFVPKDLSLLREYNMGWKVTEIFRKHGAGCESRKDKLWVAFDRDELLERLRYFSSPNVSEEDINQRLRVYSTEYWGISEAKRIVRSTCMEDYVKQFNYRPFDERFIYYNPQVIPRGSHAYPTMRHMLEENLALLACRQQAKVGFRHIFCSNVLTERCAVSLRTRELTSVFPLYLYTTPEDTEGTLFATEEVTREPNLSPQFIAAVKEKLDLDFVPDGKGDLQTCAEPAEATCFGPEDILHYAYAVFYSPTYRQRYAEFLKIDFPRLPLTSDRELFKALAEKGEELVALHLMESPKLNQLITGFPVSGSNEVGTVRYTEPRHKEETSEVSKDLGGLTPGRVYINKTQYFEGIEPAVWAFQIGGYQVLHKWLKDRQGRRLSFDDLFHYQKIVVALKETIRLMEEIDELIPAWPIE